MIKSIAAICIAISFLLLSACGGSKNESTVKVSSSTESKAPSSSVEQASVPKEVVAKVGETLDYNGLQFTLDSVETYEDTGEFAVDKADEGSSFVLLRFTVSNDTEKDQHINRFYEDSYCDDVAIDPKSMLLNPEGEAIWGDVAAGKKRKGYIAYALPTGWETLEFYYNPEVFGDDSSKMMFSVSPDDITK